MAESAICGSCHHPARKFGNVWKNSKGQYLVNIKPHVRPDGTACYARVGVVTGK